MSTITTTAAATSTPWRQWGVLEEARVRELMVISYWVLMPVVVLVGVAINTVGLYLLKRPRMRSLPVTKYFVVLLTLDVVILLTSISTILTLNGCHLQSHTAALYFAHLFFTVFYMLQTFSHYVIVWVCYDRFLALWYFQRFQETQQPQVIKLRMILTALFCVIINLRHLLDVEVVCVQDIVVVEADNHTQDCEGGAWIIKDSLRVTENRVVWRSVVRLVRGLLVIVMPVLLVLVFNLGIVIGLVRRRLFNTAATTRTRDQAYSSIYITLAISFTAVATAMPTIIHALFFATNIKNCHGPFSEEVLRASACLLLLGEHLTHFLILAINQTFRVEVGTLLHSTKTCLSRILARLAQNSSACLSHCPCTMQGNWPSKHQCLLQLPCPFICPCSCSWPCPATHPGEVASDAPVSIAKCPHSSPVPKIMVQKSEEQHDGKASVEKDIVAPKHPSLSFLLTDLELGRREEEKHRRGSHISETGQSSARISTVTLEEEDQE